MSGPPPQYVLLSHSNLVSSSSATSNTVSTLVHPSIQYQFRDDPPISVPHHQTKHVLVMDYDPASPQSLHVQSLSPQLAVTSIKVTEAPGTAAHSEDDEPKNNKMYVVETVAHQQSENRGSSNDDVPTAISLAAFKQRNALLRKALEYPLPSGGFTTTAPPRHMNTIAVSPQHSPSYRSTPLPSTN
ncbi:hypothetical protein M422DRAFT_207357 [Sphaerobolus stellatus SS14]|uniref:Uncharacterized protein n=1 Tax=Sphaerobolus stellatus (strain SS14) TaxID=990650 RepID=A0A0C9W0Y8_SPHS4|nr:hypothetical protein M422DRAFT_207357 [Sphaerobolus stellatus SS14]